MNLKARAQNLLILERLASAARRRPAKAAPSVRTEPYDWSRPHHFNRAGHRRLTALAEHAAEPIAEAVGSLLQADLALKARTPREQFSPDVDGAATPSWRVPLVADGEVVGVAALPAGMAVAWIERMLGGPARTVTDERDLSPLERALLLDVVGAACRPLAAALAESDAPAVSPGEEVFSPEEPALAGPVREMATLAFHAEVTELPDLDTGGAEAEETVIDLPDPAEGEEEEVVIETHQGSDDPARALTFHLASDFLDGAIDPEASVREPPSLEEVRRLMEEHLGRAPMTAVADLGRASVSVRDLMALEPGDVLLLDVAAGQPVALTVGGTPVARGVPARCEGQYALEICEQRAHTRATL